jgi:capsular exopolysaccharide synthesis family protein
LGLALGCGVAFAREQLDNTIRNREELQEASGAIPVLGLVPRIATVGAERRSAARIFAVSRNGASRNGDDSARVNARDEARGPVAEAFRSLRTNIAFTQPDAPAKILVITSALPGEGKSTSACNLAITLAQQGLRVVLIDADMRRASLHRSLHTALEPGLSNVLAGRAAASEAMVTLEVGETTLRFMPAGTPPPNPAELLASARVTQMLNDLRPEFDAVVIDSPPLNVVTDGAIIGSRADGVLLVARAGITDRDAYRVAIEQLQSVRARVLGCVLNDAGANAGGYYGRGTEYYRASPLPT